MSTAKTSDFHPPLSLRLGHALYDLMKGAIALFFVLLGIVALLLPWSASLSVRLEPFLKENPYLISLFGLALIIVGIGMTVLWYFNVKYRSYYIHIKPNITQVDRQVIRDTMEAYWKQRFPDNVVPMRLTLKSQSIRLIAELPCCSVDKQKQILEEIQQDLDYLFHHILGYPYDVLVSLSFAAE